MFDAGIPICTLNYDTLLEAVTGAPTVELHETYKVNAWMRGESRSILHLHGTWQSPASCVLGIRDYEATLKDDVRDLIQRSLAAFSHLLFIGCGDTFSDPNFSALTHWLKSKLKGTNLQHIALVRASELSRRNADPAWAGFVDPISFGAHHDDLPSFLLSYFPVGNATSRARSSVVAASSEAAIIEAYRAYLLKDCGQMTIEGVRADMDTAQRRFDLEKLFVPLQVLACPPEFPADDPQRETKLAKWMKKNQELVSFGQVFSKGQSLALLALPGGGKTLLLKRIAVAYADPRRRGASSDELPDSNFIPLLIRCREWRAHITLPISTLLSKLPEITGQESLSGLAAALVPHLEKGRVLLLIDGLDEIHNDAERATFVEHLESFLETYNLTRVVVTSREAGFNLVAPSLSRFCQRWRLAPLADNAIISLCGHWHRLMSGDSPEAIADGSEVAQLLLRSPPLRRLAENPLLLTMLLVVKRGAGRLPPDRVSLYERAVEVLLDTWNIKGHSSLSPKEAVPQRALT